MGGEGVHIANMNKSSLYLTGKLLNIVLLLFLQIFNIIIRNLFFYF